MARVAVGGFVGGHKCTSFVEQGLLSSLPACFPATHLELLCTQHGGYVTGAGGEKRRLFSGGTDCGFR
jgi:hypothetical protein